MSNVTNAFFRIQVYGGLADHTPASILNGVLHCEAVNTPSSGFLPIAYYNEPSIIVTPINSLKNVRRNPFSYGVSGTGGLAALGTNPFTIKTDMVEVIKGESSITVTSLLNPVVTYINCDMKITKLTLTDGPIESISRYMQTGTDVVLTTGTPTIWDRPLPTGSDIVLQSNVLELIYAALSGAGGLPLEKYAILQNTSDLATTAASGPLDTHYLTIDAYVESTGKRALTKAVNALSRANVDTILNSIAPGILERNDKLDITVNGIDDTTLNNQIYTTTLVYTGGAPSDASAYPYTPFAGLLERNPTAFANKQAICIAVSKYNTGRGIHTTSFPPFKFSYKRTDQFKILDQVKLDCTNYYYIVYQFAPSAQVRPLPLFSRPTTNREALKDVFVLSGKNDAYVDLEFPVDDSNFGFLKNNPSISASNSFLANGGVRVTYTPEATAPTFAAGAQRGSYQFFNDESDLYWGRTTETVGTKLRVYLGLVPEATSKIQINATFSNNQAWSVTIPSINIRQYSNKGGCIELQHGSTIPTPVITFNDDISQWDIQAMTSTSRSLQNLLSNCRAFNQPIGCWNTAGITNLSGLFRDCTAFNQPIGAWNTSIVTDLSSAFLGAKSFNQSLGWTVSNVSTFNTMFDGARSFNGNLVGWETKSTVGASADSMFQNAASFNKPLPANFKVNSCEAMFNGASSFDQSLSNLLLPSCTSTKDMFKNAISFNNTGTGNVSIPPSCTTAESMFEGASSWARPITFTSTSLSSVKAMFRNAKAFNQSVTITSTATTLDCESIFEGASAMNSPVTIDGGSDSNTVKWDKAFLYATTFNKDVVFSRIITSAKQMFKGASVYGNDDGTIVKPRFGVASTLVGTSTLTFLSTNGSASPVEYMFEGTRFNNVISGTAPRDVSYMLAGATYFNTPFNNGFLHSEVTSMEGMFKGATWLQVAPFTLSGMQQALNMKSMFEDANRFNGDITGWSVPSGSNVQYMLRNAPAFNQRVENWSNWASIIKTTEIRS